MRVPTIAIALTLAGCATAPAPVTRIAAPRVAVPYTSAGLERVLGRDADSLIVLFGQPQADVHEGSARKLQFQSGICVLDAYLYPKGGGARVVTYVDARQPDGADIDRASCVAALTRRSGGR